MQDVSKRLRERAGLGLTASGGIISLELCILSELGNSPFKPCPYIIYIHIYIYIGIYSSFG